MHSECVCSAFSFQEIANLINVKPETARTWSFLLPSPDVGLHPTAAGAPAVHPVARGLVESQEPAALSTTRADCGRPRGNPLTCSASEHPCEWVQEL